MRLLFTAACGFASAALAAHYALPFAWLPWCALALFALALPALLMRGDARTRAVLLLVSAALGAGWYWGYTQLFVRPAEALAGRELSFTARVLESPERDEGFAMTYVRLEQEGLPAVRTAVYDYDGYLGDVQPGDLVELTARTSSATERYGAETDIYSSRGILLRANLSAPSGVPRRDGWSWLHFPARLSAAVGEKAQQLFPADTAAFMRALLVGDSSGLDDDYELEHALDESGIRHVVAVSGMHLSYLCAFLTALLGRRRAAKLGVPAAVVFTFMAGATPSIVRACVMLLLVMAAPLARREADGLTSLGAALLLLLVINPLSVAAAGLQLSFAAMAGIVTVTPAVYAFIEGRWKKPEGRRGRLRSFIIATLAGTAGSAVFTTPIVALTFGYVSLVSPLTNLLTLWAVSGCFILGLAAVILGFAFAPLGAALAWLDAWCARYICLCAEAMSALPFAAVYTADRLVSWWLCFCYGVFALAWLLRGKGQKLWPLAPAAACAVALCAVIFSASAAGKREQGFVFLDVGQGACTLALDGEHAVVIDCGGTGTLENAGDTACEYLLSRGRRSVDAVVLTHLHSDHAGGVTRLLSRLDVGELYIAEAAEDTDGELAGLLACAERHGTAVRYVGAEDVEENYGGIALTLYAPAEAGDENERGVAVLASVGGWDALVMGDLGMAAERELAAEGAIPDVDILAVGHHGSRYSTSFELLEAAQPEMAVISVGYNNYGHPADEALARLNLAGARVYRTDIDGSITVRTGDDGKKDN